MSSTEGTAMWHGLVESRPSRSALGAHRLPGRGRPAGVSVGARSKKLRDVMGHCSVQWAERYAHLRPDMFGAADLARVAVDLSAPAGKIIPSRHLRPLKVGQLATLWLRPTRRGGRQGPQVSEILVLPGWRNGKRGGLKIR
jgi:hypothetical protein